MGTNHGGPVHPEALEALSFFEHEHLPEEYATFSRRFEQLATELVAELTGSQLTLALHKLIEAKDCAIRAKALMVRSNG